MCVCVCVCVYIYLHICIYKCTAYRIFQYTNGVSVLQRFNVIQCKNDLHVPAVCVELWLKSYSYIIDLVIICSNKIRILARWILSQKGYLPTRSQQSLLWPW